MPFAGTYLWQVRQKVGHDKLIMPTVSILAVRQDGAVMMVYNKDFNTWVFPGGYVEMGRSWSESALTELEEEAGIVADKASLTPFAIVSGKNWQVEYGNGDKLQNFEAAFICRNWQSETDKLDETEISDKRFFTVDEIDNIEFNGTIFPPTVLSAYKKYLETGEFQVVEV